MKKHFVFLGVCFLFFFFHSGAQSNSSSDSIKTLALFQTIRSGDVEKLKEMLNSGFSAKAKSDGYSALMSAALNGSVEEMQILIDHGADINYQNEDSVNALWLAVPDYDKCKLLLNAGARPQDPGKGGYRPIVKLATTPGSAPLMQLFITKGAILKQSAPDGFLLYNAAMTNDTAILGICIRGGLNVNDTTWYKDYAIFSALTNRSFNTLKMLVDNGADVNVQDTSSNLKDTATPLMTAASNNDSQSFFYLLEHGADPNIKSMTGMTVLMCAMQSGVDDPGITKALLDRGAKVSDKMNDGSDALYFAKRRGNTESIKLLQEYLK